MNSFDLFTIKSSYKKEIKDKIKIINTHITELNEVIIAENQSTSSKKEKNSEYENMIYTDGSCSKNGSKNASGAIGIYIFSSLFGNDIKIGKRIDYTECVYEKKVYQYPVSNIRTEGYAILYTMILFSQHCIYNTFTSSSNKNIIQWLNSFSLPPLQNMKTMYKKDELVVKKQGAKKQVHIFTDSKFWIDVYTSWMPNWIQKGILLEKKNIDLLLYGYYYYTLLKHNNIEVVFHHVYSHQKGNIDVHAKRNNIVDQIAVQANVDSTNPLFNLF